MEKRQILDESCSNSANLVQKFFLKIEKSQILSMDKELKKITLMALGLSVFVVLLTLAIPFNMIMLFRFVVPSESESSIIPLASAALVGLLFMAVFESLRFALLRKFSLYLDKMLGEKILLGMITDYAQQQKSEYSVAMNDLTKVRSFFASPASTALLDTAIAPLQMILVFFLSPIMGFLSVICILVIMSTKFIGSKHSKEMLYKARLRFNATNNFAQECTQNAHVVQAMGMQPQLLKKWREMQNEVVKNQAIASESAGVHSAFTKSMGWIMQVLLMGIGFSLVLTGEIDGGFMIIAVIIAGRLIMPMQGVVNGWKEIVEAKDAYTRLKLFAEEMEKKEKKENFSLPKPKGELKAESLVYSLNKKALIKSVSFELNPGQSLGLIGLSGAGKSTLAKLLTGTIRPQNGVLRLDNADMHQWDQDQLGKHIGYLPQEVELFPGTIFQNIARFQDVEFNLVEEAAIFAGVHQTILELPDGYDTVLEEQAINLPGGLRQRIGLARSVFGMPTLLILDEPDANLDKEGIKALIRLIKKSKLNKITLILITHRKTLLLALDKIMMLQDGQTVLYGPRKDIMNKIFSRQSKTKQLDENSEQGQIGS